MNSLARSIHSYISAKDGNRPHLLSEVFAEDALLTMIVRTDSIAFPATSVGRDAIADTLVRRFNQTYENIYTFCLGAPPVAGTEAFSCDWLVAMSEKQSQAVRIGRGRYDWAFSHTDNKVGALTITIDVMEEIAAADALEPVMNWARALPYPWCPRELLEEVPTKLLGIAQVLHVLRGFLA